MFIVDKDLTYINPSGKKFLSILKSSNQPFIAAADRPAEPTEAYICSFEKKNKKIETYIMLYLLKSGIRVFYKSEKGEFSIDEFGEVESDALEFMESMGFMMDNLGVTKMGEEGKNEILTSLPVFIDPDKVSEPKVAQQSEDTEYVSAAELAEGLEEVLSDKDLQDMELGKEQKRKGSIEDLEGNLAKEASDLDTKADLLEQDEKDFAPAQKLQKAKPIHVNEDKIKKIARIISSF